MITIFAQSILLLTAIAVSSIPSVNEIKVGELSISDIARQQNTSHVANHVIYSKKTTFTKEARTLKAKKGLVFGMHFNIKAPIKPVLLTTEIEFPGNGLTNPSTGETQKSAQLEYVVKSTSAQSFYYMLEQDWEVVPGKWTFILKLNGYEKARESIILE